MTSKTGNLPVISLLKPITIMTEINMTDSPNATLSKAIRTMGFATALLLLPKSIRLAI